MATSAIGSIIRAATRPVGAPLNILTFSTHEAYQSTLANLPHHFYLYEQPGMKTWNSDFRKLPSNHTIIQGSLPPHVDLDLVLTQEVTVQYPIARQISRELQLPLIGLEHTLPHPQVTQSYLAMHKQQHATDVQVFISEFSRKGWGWTEDEARVIHHGIDTELFTPEGDRGREAVLLSVVNQWQSRDWCCGWNYWKEATEGLPVYVLGDNPGLSKPAESVQGLAHAFRSSLIFVNTSTVSPVPTALLEAMAAGCCVVSTSTCMIPEIIDSGFNGVLCSLASDMKSTLKDLLNNPKTCETMGRNARQAILDKFSKEKFLSNWDTLFRDTVTKFTPGINK